MTTKLTLSVNSKTIAKAKKYAKKRGTSISKIFEEHISAVTDLQKNDPLETLRRLKGVAKNISPDVDYKDLIADAIIEKHLK